MKPLPSPAPDDAAALLAGGDCAAALHPSLEAAERWAAAGNAAAEAAALLDAAHAHLELRRHADAAQTLARAELALARAPADAALRVRLRCLQARLHHFRREAQAARAAAHDALTLAEAMAGPGRAAALAAARFELARILFGFDPSAALDLLDEVEEHYAAHGQPVAAAYARYIRGLACDQANRHAEALTLYDAARAVFAAHGAALYVALCDAMRAAALWRLDRYDEALPPGEAARAWFAAHDLPVWTAMACNNLAVLRYARRELPAAAALYAEAAGLARAEGLRLDEALCRVNLGLVEAEQGRYDRALPAVQRARALFAAEGRALAVAECDQNLARLLLRLGRPGEALAELEAVRDEFTRLGRPLDAALTGAHLAELHLALGQPAAARTAAERAFAALDAQGAEHQAALARRLHGEALAALGDVPAGRAQIQAARSHFAARGLEADAALCDLALAEALVAQGEEGGEAQALLAAAAPTIAAAAPAAAWRVEAALAAGASERGDAPAALAHSLAALHRVAAQRGRLPTEQWSGSFGAAQKRLYARTLDLALALGNDPAALAAAEAAKTQSFSARLGAPALRAVPAGAEDDPYLAALAADETRLRRALDDAQRAARVGFEAEAAGAPVQGAALRALAAEYERTVEALRVARPRRARFEADGAEGGLLDAGALRAGLAGLHAPWAALSYAFHGDRLIAFFLDASRLVRHEIALTALDRMLLRQATATDAASRALVYGARGDAPLAQRHLAVLGARLLPPEVAALCGMGRQGAQPRLFLSPDGPLHTLPLHALEVEGAPLGARVAVAYAPSLAALARLLELPAAPLRLPALVCGLGEFAGRAPALPAAQAEVQAVAALAGPGARLLWGPEAATRAALLSLSEEGGLRGLGALHLATHARLAHDAPSRSALLLADGDLTLYDILNLDLAAGVVTLSACDGATGRALGGNELMSLAWAWLQAGARTVVASLWPVADEHAVALMAEFYGRLPLHAPGPWPPGTVAAALAGAQDARRARGAPLHAWAPWVAIGC